ncbi:MAG TPA: hypothetical protein VH682_23510 [Gemmataceae bacterium]|jgi:hypothetical protein
MFSSLRQTLLPLDHVYAELLAYPLASEEAFHAGLVRLDPPRAGGPLDLFWQAFERNAFHGLPGTSIDEMACLRDRVWYGAPGVGGCSLHAYLRRHAEGLLRSAGHVAEPRPVADGGQRETYHPDEADGEEGMVAARRRWRWLTFALPPDLLLAALPAEPPPTRVDTLSPLLRTLLADHGYAETHVHVNAAIDFSHLWASLQYSLAQVEGQPDRFASSGAAFEHGRQFGDWLLRAAIARCVVAAYLVNNRSRYPDLLSYFLHESCPRIRDKWGPSVERSVRSGLDELCEGRLAAPPASWEDLGGVYRDLYDAHARDAIELGMLGRIDPVRGLLEWQDSDLEMPEARWLRAGLGWMGGPGAADACFAKLFWQVVRVRCLFYRHVVQRPMTPGLHWFLRFYSRIKHARGWFDRDGGRAVASALRLHGEGSGLRSLEVRTAPEPTSEEQLDYLAKALLGAKGARADFGLVLHFIKDRGDQIAGGFPAAHGECTHADPTRPPHAQVDPNPTGYRYAQYYRSRSKQADALVQLLNHHPDILRWLRGVDICNDERAIPNWVLADPYRRVFLAGERASRRLGDGTLGLRRTIHVGEDFVHPLSGLRLVAEAIHFFGLRAGDRLGHALALGVDFVDWAARAGRVALRREERLFDLAWEHHHCSRRRSPAANRLPFVESEIRRLGAEIFGAPFSPAEIHELVVDLHTPDLLKAIGFPDGIWERNKSKDRRRDGLLFDYLTSGAVFRAGQVTEWVAVREEGAILAALQAEVRREVSLRGVVVEVNPSSNLLIGEFGDLRRHPFWRLAGSPGAEIDAPPILVCLGSDDPITFATDIRQEYQLVHDALLSAGNSAEDALRWVDRLRAIGLASRFTLTSGRR